MTEFKFGRRVRNDATTRIHRNPRVGRRIVSKEEIVKIRKFFKAGMQQTEIARKMLLSLAQVHRVVHGGKSQQELDVARIAMYKGKYPVFATALPETSDHEDIPIGEWK